MTSQIYIQIELILFHLASMSPIRGWVRSQQAVVRGCVWLGRSIIPRRRTRHVVVLWARSIVVGGLVWRRGRVVGLLVVGRWWLIVGGLVLLVVVVSLVIRRWWIVELTVRTLVVGWRWLVRMLVLNCITVRGLVAVWGRMVRGLILGRGWIWGLVAV